MKSFLAGCLLSLLVIQVALSNIYHVSTTGSDITGDGTAAKPWKTLLLAVNRVAANQGHTIQLAQGTYTENGLIAVPTGVNITGAGMDLTILKAASSFFYNPATPGYATNKFLISLNSPAQVNGNQTLGAFTIDGGVKQLHGGIFVQHRNNIILDHVKVKNTNFTGVWLWDVKDSKIRNSTIINSSWGSSSYCSGALNIGNLERVEIDGLTVDENTGYGIKAIGPPGNNNLWYVNIHNSHISVAPFGLWGGGMAPNMAIEFWQVNLVGNEIHDSYVDNTISLVNSNALPATGIQTLRVHHNIIDIETRANGAGYGVELTIHDVEIDHNFFLKGDYGIANWYHPMTNWSIHHNSFYALQGTYPGEVLRVQSSGLHNVKMYNNTVEFAGTKTMNFLGLYGGSSDNVDIKNNLVINNNTSYSYYANQLIHLENGAVLTGLQVKNNSIYKMPVGTVPGTYQNNITTDPRILATGNRPDPYYTPATGSPLINAGLNVGLPFTGSAPDIGAFEFAAPANILPSVALTSPVNNASVSSGTTVIINATASDTDGTVAKVEFFQGATLLGQDLTSPYSFAWVNVPSGSYSLTARATDNLGGIKVSTAVALSVTGNTLPTVSLTSPINNATFVPGSTVPLTAVAADPGGSVTKVEFLNGTTVLGQDLTSPYTFSWVNVPAGNYSITARATDNLNATKVSTAVAITVGVPATIQLRFDSSDAILSGGMISGSDATAAMGSYFAMPTGSGRNYMIPPPAKATFNFNLSAAGNFVVWMKTKSLSAQNQAHYIYDGKGNWLVWSSGVHSTWTWSKITNNNVAVLFSFNQGVNSLSMYWYDENAQVDQIIVTNDLTYTPGQDPAPPSQFIVFPNPVTSNTLTIRYTSIAAQQAQVSIFNNASTLVFQTTANLVTGINDIVVDVTYIYNGPHVLSFQPTAGGPQSTQILINH